MSVLCNNVKLSGRTSFAVLTTAIEARYWRIYQADNTRNGGQWHIGQFGIADASGYLPLSSSNLTSTTLGSGMDVNYLISTSYASYFLSSAPGNWIAADLGEAKQVLTVRFYSPYSTSNYAPDTIWIQSSNDGTNWTTQVVYEEGHTNSLQYITVSTPPPPPEYRYWRLYQDSATRAGSPGYEWHMNSFSMVTTLGVVGLSENTTSTELRSDGSPLDRFFQTDTYGVFSTYPAGNWLATDFTTPVRVATVTYKNAVGGSWAPIAVKVQGSTNGINWVDVKSHADVGDTSLQTITL